MKSYKESVDKVYEKIDNCIIIGLTGRTGSGCTTTSKILETSKFECLALSSPKKRDFNDVEERKNAKIYKYMKKEWSQFVTIEASSVILSFVLERRYDDFEKFIDSLCSKDKNPQFRIVGYDELKRKMKGLKSIFDNKIDFSKEASADEIDEIYNYFIRTLKEYKKTFFDIFIEYSGYEISKSNFVKQKEKKLQLYTYLLQTFGNNIRSSGDPYVSKFDKLNFNKVAERIENVIEIIKKYNQYNNQGNKNRICIDAIRNPYEAHYLRDTYKTFYLVSVNTDDAERVRRLSKFDDQELAALDEMEYPSEIESGKIFYQQSIQECLQIADIHLYNPYSNDSEYEKLTSDLVRYVALMLHPGLITPTNIERCMQVAYNAKFNSGCLSRQVGSVITDENFYVKAIGWNEVPQGQVSCSLRSVFDFFSDRDKDTYSKFELENKEFKSSLEKIKSEYNSKSNDICENYCVPFCFKDVYNAIRNDKNQVYTRSLHAEENSFLQASKFGGKGICGGKLFVTASPCELCSKKSYQLGIKDIYYIDPYPGIASSHILKLGDKESNPNLHIFYGAIGSAYISLYSQRFAIKDELQLLSGIKMKDVISNRAQNDESVYNNIEYNSLYLELKFETRTDIEFKQNAEVKVKANQLSELPKTMCWTGSSYDRTTINDDEGKYTLIDEKLGDGMYRIVIKPKCECKSGKKFKYSITSYLKDSKSIMNPMLSYHARSFTKNLKLCVKFNKEHFNEAPHGLKINKYADIDKNLLFESEEIKIINEENYYIVEENIEKPYLLYTYAIEWDFN